MRESGPAEAPDIVFLHGGALSGWAWQPVVDRMPEYRCLVPDLPEHGNSFQQGPFEIDWAAAAVAELIRSKARGRRAHVVGHSLGAQVGVQLLATQPDVVDHAVFCGAYVNGLPSVAMRQPFLGLMAWNGWFQAIIRNARYSFGISPVLSGEDRNRVRLTTRSQQAHVIRASSQFRPPEGLDKSNSPTLFITGEKEMGFVHRTAAAFAQRMPNGVNGVALGMGHKWPLTHPDLFARTLHNWLDGAAPPPEIRLTSCDWR